MSSAVIRPTRSMLPTLLHAVDSFLICISFPLTSWLLGVGLESAITTPALMASVLFFLTGELLGVYRPSRGRSADVEVGLITIAWTVAFLLLLVLGVWTSMRLNESGWWFASVYMLTGLNLLASHMIVRVLMETLTTSGYMSRRTAIVGFNRLGLEIAHNATRAGDCGMKVVGIYDDRRNERLEKLTDSPVPFLGTSHQLLESIGKGEIDTVLITLPMRAEKRIQGLLDILANSTVSVYLVPDFFVFELIHSRWTQVGGLPVVSVFESPIYGVDGWIKRIVDLVLSVIGVVLISPILLVCAVLIRWTSPGPVFFRQKRYGLDGKEILVWKFRTMYTCDNGPVVKQATKDDPRVTPVGRILRKTSLDELPQLFNVIAGNMSLVGPRPHATAHNEHFRSLIRGYMMRHKVKPGITGLAQVFGSRGETDTLEKMEHRISLDHRYLREWSLWLDFKILLRTITVVLKQDAY